MLDRAAVAWGGPQTRIARSEWSRACGVMLGTSVARVGGRGMQQERARVERAPTIDRLAVEARRRAVVSRRAPPRVAAALGKDGAAPTRGKKRAVSRAQGRWIVTQQDRQGAVRA